MPARLFPNGSAPRFGSSLVVDEELFSLEACGFSVVRERSLPGCEETPKTLPNLGRSRWAHRGESGQVESPDNADILWVSRDFLDGVFGRIMLSSMVLRRWWQRSQRRMYMGLVPRKWSVRNMPLSTVPLSISCPQSSETYERDRKRTWLTPARSGGHS